MNYSDSWYGLSKIRIFNGEAFYLKHKFLNKSEAKTDAEFYRSRGLRARVVPATDPGGYPKYVIYTDRD